MMRPNPDLAVNADRLAAWNTPERRRESFKRLHLLHRRGLSLRAASVLRLTQAEAPDLAASPGLSALLARPEFCAMCLIQDDRILFERYAPDCGPEQLHSMQSITKTMAHLAMGSLVEAGRVDPEKPVGKYVPEAGVAYAGASIQQVLDMAVTSNFEEDYEAPYAPAPLRGEAVGYARQEIAMGWRLPPEGEAEFGVRDFASALVARANPRTRDHTQYASPNTDMLGWVIERASGRPLGETVAEIVEAAGIEGSFHISLDCRGVPVLSGGGVMTARDLARYGLLLARRSLAFLADAMSGAGTRYHGSERLRYRNHLLSNGTWVGHPGYAGQFLMVDPARRAAVAFYSVLESRHGNEDGYFASVMSALEGLLRAVP